MQRGRMQAHLLSSVEEKEACRQSSKKKQVRKERSEAECTEFGYCKVGMSKRGQNAARSECSEVGMQSCEVAKRQHTRGSWRIFCLFVERMEVTLAWFFLQTRNHCRKEVGHWLGIKYCRQRSLRNCWGGSTGPLQAGLLIHPFDKLASQAS